MLVIAAVLLVLGVIFYVPIRQRMRGKYAVHTTGTSLKNLTAVQFASLDSIDDADWSQYATCRGRADQGELEHMFDVILDENADDDDEQLEAICDGLWDLLSHQGTLYSVTPLGLHRLLGRTTAKQRQSTPDVQEFIAVCRKAGTSAVWLTGREIRANRKGELPIYSIEEVLALHDGKPRRDTDDYI